MLAAFHGMFRTMLDASVITLAVVRGQCLGGGLELAAFCHRVFAAEDARLGQPEIALGVFAPVASVILCERMGRGGAEDLALIRTDHRRRTRRCGSGSSTRSARIRSTPRCRTRARIWCRVRRRACAGRCARRGSVLPSDSQWSWRAWSRCTSTISCAPPMRTKDCGRFSRSARRRGGTNERGRSVAARRRLATRGRAVP